MDLRKIYPPRPDEARKGDHGYVLIVGGSRLYSGSPVYNAMSALRCGADLVTVAGHARAMDIAARYAPEMITYPLSGEFDVSNMTEVLALVPKFDALVIGGGMERSQRSFSAIRDFISAVDLPMVIDAEAIRAVAEDREVLVGKRAVLTPNVPEFTCLGGDEAGEDIEERKRSVSDIAKELGGVIALKGNADIISDGERIAVNRTGTPYMSKGGFGDTLAGICGAILARGADPLVAAETSCYINGKAGEAAASLHGESLIASDLFDYFPGVLKGKYS